VAGAGAARPMQKHPAGATKSGTAHDKHTGPAEVGGVSGWKRMKEKERLPTCGG